MSTAPSRSRVPIIAEILGPDGVVRASSEPSRVGHQAHFGAGSAGAGRAWFGDQDIDDVHNLVGQVPILDINGGVLAVVSVSERYPSIWELLSAPVNGC